MERGEEGVWRIWGALLYPSSEERVVCCRAWVMHSSHPSDLVRVFYLDYGNTAAIPWSHTAKASERWLWELQPMAVPFTLTGQCPAAAAAAARTVALLSVVL